PGTVADAVTSTNVTPAAAPGTLFGWTGNSYNNISSAGTGFTFIDDNNANAYNGAFCLNVSKNICIQKKAFASPSPVAALFTLAGGGGRSSTIALAVKEAASYVRFRGNAVM